MSREIGETHLATIKAFFEDGGLLPVSPKDGFLNMSELVRITGVPRSSFYQHDAIADSVDEACKKQGVKKRPTPIERRVNSGERGSESIDASDRPDKSKLLEKRVHRLEQQNAALTAENLEMRKQLKQLRLQLGRDDMQIETGRRIQPPAEHE